MENSWGYSLREPNTSVDFNLEKLHQVLCWRVENDHLCLQWERGTKSMWNRIRVLTYEKSFSPRVKALLEPYPTWLKIILPTTTSNDLNGAKETKKVLKWSHARSPEIIGFNRDYRCLPFSPLSNQQGSSIIIVIHSWKNFYEA